MIVSPETFCSLYCISVASQGCFKRLFNLYSCHRIELAPSKRWNSWFTAPSVFQTSPMIIIHVGWLRSYKMRNPISQGEITEAGPPFWEEERKFKRLIRMQPWSLTSVSLWEISRQKQKPTYTGTSKKNDSERVDRFCHSFWSWFIIQSGICQAFTVFPAPTHPYTRKF